MSKSVTLSPSAATTGRKKNTTITSIAGAAKVQPASERVMERLRRGHRPGQASTAASPGSHRCGGRARRSEEHTSEFQSLMRISYAVFCLKKQNNTQQT